MSSVVLCLIPPADSRAAQRLGDPLLDAYLEFLSVRCRPNSVLAARFDLTVFFAVVSKPVGEVKPADVLGFITAQRTGSPVLPDPLVVPAPEASVGVSLRTVRRRLSTVSGVALTSPADIKRIIAAAAPTLAGVYRNLTGGSDDPFPTFKALLDEHFPRTNPDGSVRTGPQPAAAASRRRRCSEPGVHTPGRGQRGISVGHETSVVGVLPSDSSTPPGVLLISSRLAGHQRP